MPEWKPTEINTLKTLANDGASRLRIAAKLGRSMTSVVAMAKQQGIQLKTVQDVRKANGLLPNWTANRSF